MSDAAAGAVAADDGARTQFEWFVTLWVMAFSFHYLETRPFQGWAVIAAGVFCLIRPGSLRGFALFLAVSTWTVTINLPAPANHFVVALIVNLTLAAAALGSAAAGRHASWIDRVRSPAALTLGVVYFFGAFHKLNTSFFDPAVSCAGSLLQQIFYYQDFDAVPIPGAVIIANAVFTVAVEAALAVCVLVPRWRRWGLVIAIVFHTGLALARFYDFATFAFALWVLSFPPRLFAGIAADGRWRRWALGGWIGAVIVSVGQWASSSSTVLPGVTWHTVQVLAWMAAVMPLTVPLCRASVRHASGAVAAWQLQPVALWLFPLIAFVNGATPYLGVKTVANYSMFSNLRTEDGRTNHFLQAVSELEMTGYLRDVVEITRLEIPEPPALSRFERGSALVVNWFKGTPSRDRWRRQMRWANEEVIRLPWLELRRAVLLWKSAGVPGIRVRFVRGGVERDVFDATADPELAAPLPFWTRRLLAFRAIEPGGGVHCRW